LSACQLLKVSLTRDTATHHENLNIIGCGRLGKTLGRLAVDCHDDVTRVFHLALIHPG
jgi:hypothetical protein